MTAQGEHGSITDHIALLRTHPSGERRLQILEERLPAAIKIYEQVQAERKARAEVEAVMKAARTPAGPAAEGGEGASLATN